MSYEKAKSLMAKGVSRPTLYKVKLPIDSKAREFVHFYCKATSIPDVRLETASINGQEHMGIVRQQPTSMIFGKPFTMTIIESKEFNVYKELRAWMNRTTLAANQEMNLVSSRNMRMFYYDSYVKDFSLLKLEYLDSTSLLSDTVFNKLGQIDRERDSEFRPDEDRYDKPLRINFIRAYPVSIGAISLSSDAYDTLTEFTVDFTYETYNVDYPNGFE